MATEFIAREEGIKTVLDKPDMTPDEKAGVVARLQAIPAADVRPVVRGHYVGEYDGYADGNPVYDMWYCSECGCCFEDWDEKPTYNFCPNCGADMSEVKTDEK